MPIIHFFRSTTSNLSARVSIMSSGGSSLNYSAALSQGIANNGPRSQTVSSEARPAPRASREPGKTSETRRSPSPSHIPQTGRDEDTTYVLTILTDKPLHERMTELRRAHFPKKINKLAAHLTLFHALPGSKLDSHIIPTILDVTRDTAPFRINATELFRLKKGFAISVADQEGGRQSKQIHHALQAPWKREGWLSTQDAGGCRVHYTLMNKVDEEEEIQKAYDEMSGSWKGDSGVAEGLGLWRYDRGFWRWERKFSFQKNGER